MENTINTEWQEIAKSAYELKEAVLKNKKETDSFFNSVIETFRKQWQQKSLLDQTASKTLGASLFSPWREAAFKSIQSAGANEKIHGYVLLLMIEGNLFFDQHIQLNAQQGETTASLAIWNEKEFFIEISNENTFGKFSHRRLVISTPPSNIFCDVSQPIHTVGSLAYPYQSPPIPVEKYEGDEAKDIIIQVLKYHFEHKKADAALN